MSDPRSLLLWFMEWGLGHSAVSGLPTEEEEEEGGGHAWSVRPRGQVEAVG